MIIGSFVYSINTPELYQSFQFIQTGNSDDAIYQKAFSKFMTEYKKTYASSEETTERLKIFTQNYIKIQEHNSNPEKSVTLGINQFADLTDEEFAARHLSKSVEPAPELPADLYRTIDPNLNINWNDKGKVTKVKDQGNCGSCWTFSSISVVETLWAIRRNSKPDRLSEQMLVDCCRTKDSNGCHGGEEFEALEYIKTKGIAFEVDYPYHARDEKCREGEVTVQLKTDGWARIDKGYTSEMEKVIQNRTLSVALFAGAFGFRFYKSGVLDQGCPWEDLNHAVTAVGAGTENGKPYWLVRNSWGPNWGDKGHIKIARTEDGHPGICGIASSVHYPLYQEPK